MPRPRTSFVPPVAIDRGASRPFYGQVYDWFRAAILSGQLHPGQRVPSTRALAAELRISRIPVLTAFEQLHAEGYLETMIGSGTRVARSIPHHRSASRASTARSAPARRRPLGISRRAEMLMALPPETWLHTTGAFRVSLPALDHFPHSLWAKLVGRHARTPEHATLMYSDPMGLPALRQAIAEYVGATRGVRCDASRVMVVAGSQHGLQLAAHVLLDRDDAVWVEDPGYPGAHRALVMAGARLMPVAVDQDGLNVDDGVRRCPDARAVYVTPSHQYPLGMTMSAARRMQLLHWAARTGAWIIEDDYDSEYRFAGKPIAALQGLDDEARVIYAGTFSKVMFPSLRVGYLILPTDLVPAFVASREATDIFSSTLHQAALADFITEGHFARHIRRSRALYMERRSTLIEAIGVELGDRLEIVGADAGLHVAGLLPPGASDTAVSARAGRRGISVMPLSTCYLRKPPRGGLILGYGGTDVAQIRSGVRSLGMSLSS